MNTATQMTSANKSQITKCAKTTDRNEATKPGLPSNESSNEVTKQAAGEKAGYRANFLNSKNNWITKFTNQETNTKRSINTVKNKCLTLEHLKISQIKCNFTNSAQMQLQFLVDA